MLNTSQSDTSQSKFLYSFRATLLCIGVVAALGSATASALAATPGPDRPGADSAEAGTAEERQALREELRAERIADREARATARFEGHLTFLKTRLGITEAQTPLWESFAQSLRDGMDARDDTRLARRDSQAGPPALLERLDRHQERLAREAERLQARSNSLRPLYAALDEEQREIAERVLDFGDRRMAMGDGAGPHRGMARREMARREMDRGEMGREMRRGRGDDGATDRGRRRRGRI